VVTNAQSSHDGAYSVVITNVLGTVTSDDASLTVEAASEDADNDGLPDAWEAAHGLSSSDPADADADSDGDRLSNRQEYLAGTDPQDPLSNLRIEATGNGDGVVLSFTAISNKTYSVLCKEVLADGLWQSLTNVNAMPTNRPVVLTNAPNGFLQRYYRLVTPQEP
jgi:hypothetical protein